MDKIDLVKAQGSWAIKFSLQGNRLLVDDYGYITKEKSDVSGVDSGNYNGLFYQATMPGYKELLKGVIDTLKRGS